MKSKGFSYLITTNAIEAKMYQDLLLKQGIHSELHPASSMTEVFARFGGGNLMYSIRVPSESLVEAKELLNIDEVKGAEYEYNGNSLLVRVVLVALFILFVLLVLSILSPFLR